MVDIVLLDAHGERRCIGNLGFAWYLDADRLLTVLRDAEDLRHCFARIVRL